MANTSAAKKAARQTLKHREHNVNLVSRFRTSIKKVVKALDEKNLEEAKTAYASAVSLIDSTADKGLIHKNKAARHKSRLNARLKSLAAS